MKVDRDDKLDMLNVGCEWSIRMVLLIQQASGAMGVKLRRETWAGHGKLVTLSPALPPPQCS